MNEVSADHASHIVPYGHKRRKDFRSVTALLRYGVASIWFDVYVLCGSVTVPSITGIFDQMLYYIQGDTLYTY
jgi:hypothetical protein